MGSIRVFIEQRASLRRSDRAAPGVVVAAGWSDDFGNYVMVEHELYDNKFYSIYAHLGTERNSGVFVGVGEDVNSDTIIGTTGKTKGDDMVPAHLHFEVRTAGNVNLASSGSISRHDIFGGMLRVIGVNTFWYRVQYMVMIPISKQYRNDMETNRKKPLAVIACEIGSILLLGGCALASQPSPISTKSPSATIPPRLWNSNCRDPCFTHLGFEKRGYSYAYGRS